MRRRLLADSIRHRLAGPPRADSHCAILDPDERRAEDVDREQVEVALGPPVEGLVQRLALAVPLARVADLDGVAVELEVAFAPVPVARGAVDDAARVASQVERLGR